MNKLYKNEYLFSEIYLEEITNFEEKPEVVSSLKTLKDYLEYSNKESLSEWKNSFIQKVFGVLGFDYKSVSDNLIQLSVQGNKDPISLCFTLLPADDLDNATIGRHWSEKIIRNLRSEKLNWGILTNGIRWRIYHIDEPTPYENYIELDLQKILEAEDSKNYMVFFEFMKADNFVLGDDSKCKFDEFKKDSYEKIEYIEEELKNALKQEQEDGKGVLADLCMGYVEFLKSKGKNNFKDDAFRKEIYSGAMLYMFRLLFLFYASARDLLTNEEIDSFHKLLKKSKNLFKSNKASHTSYELWQELREIFGIIDVHYNGGLFDPLENKFIENNRVSDYFLCRVLYNMNFYEDEDGNEKPISYRDMGVRHLGTLYEGLLEHKLFLAEEDTEVKFVKGEIKFIPESDGGVIVEGKYIPKGQVYFGTDKYERKSTGSYFTPEYIVDYIVTNTVGEKLKELREEFDAQNKELLEDIKITSDEKERNVLIRELREKLLEFARKKILKLSVLDPAMGSGHFLVNASTQISNFITEFLNEQDLDFKDTSYPIYWRRRVVENCIYGVDINPLAVELAKLSLWILSMAKDAHLSFLNHHLKCGNSLIGARLSDIGIYPGQRKIKKSQISIWDKDLKFKETVEQVINDYLAIEERETVNKKDIEFKKALLEEIDNALIQYKKVCDFHTSIYFDVEVDEQEYFSTIKKSVVLDNHTNQYFHWELEFPEIFHNNNGFNCLIGNPPYLNIYSINSTLKEFIKANASIYPSAHMKYDLYVIFIDLGILLLQNQGVFGMIVSNKWMNNSYGTKIRQRLISETQLRVIIDFKLDIFEASVDTTVLVFSRGNSKKNFDAMEVCSNDSPNITHLLKNPRFKKIDQNYFNKLNESVFRLNLTTQKKDILEKIRMKSYSLSEICYCGYGLRLVNTDTGEGKSSYISDLKISNDYQPYIEGKDLGKWKIKSNKFLRYEPTTFYNAMFEELFFNDRLICLVTLSDISKLRFCFENKRIYANHSTVISKRWCDLIGVNHNSVSSEIDNQKINLSRKYEYAELQAVLNSQIVKFFFNELQYDGVHFYPNHIRSLPIIKYEFWDTDKIRKLTADILSETNDNIIEKLEISLNEILFDYYELDSSERLIVFESLK